MAVDEKAFFVIPLAIFCSAACPFFFALYLLNRHVYPLAQREPIITLGANIAFWLAAQIWMFELNYYEIPCIVDNFSVQILVGITMVLFCMRVWKIYMDAGLTNELERDKHGWFVKHRSWRSRRSLNMIASVMIAFHCVMFVVATVDDGHNAFREGNFCDATTSSLILAALGVVYLLIFVTASCKLAKVRDNFYIKSELRMVGIGSGSLALGWMTKVAADLPCSFPECGTMLLWFCWFCCFLASTIYPLTKAMWDRKFIWWWDLCRRGMLRRAREQLCCCHRDHDTSYGDGSRTTQESFGNNDESQISQNDMRHMQFERNPMRVLSNHLNPKDPAVAKLKRLPLKRLLAYNQGREAFRKFTVMEFSVENLLFMEAVNKFRALDEPTKADLQELYDKYVSTTAPSQVNLPMKILRQMTNNLATIEGAELRVFFDEALDHVMKLMSRDSYRRFQDTAEFAMLATEIEELRMSISSGPPTQETQTTTNISSDKSSMTLEQLSLAPTPSHNRLLHSPTASHVSGLAFNIGTLAPASSNPLEMPPHELAIQISSREAPIDEVTSAIEMQVVAPSNISSLGTASSICETAQQNESVTSPESKKAAEQNLDSLDVQTANEVPEVLAEPQENVSSEEIVDPPLQTQESVEISEIDPPRGSLTSKAATSHQMVSSGDSQSYQRLE